MAQVADGIDPIAAQQAAKVKAQDSAEGTLRAVAKNYMALEGHNLRSARERQSVINAVLPKLGDQQVTALRRTDIVKMLDRIAIERGPGAADMTLAVLRAVLNWHEQRSDDFRNPLVRMKARVNPIERARKRVLTDNEIAAIWKTCDNDMGVVGRAYQVLLLTGARRNEVAGMRRKAEIGVEVVRNGAERKLDVWTLPAARSKNKADVKRPLSKAALAIIESVPRIVGSDFVFTRNGRIPVRLDSGDNNPKGALDEISGVTGWHVHDLRRTARTLMSRLGVSFDISEMCLGHQAPGGLLRRTYDQHNYLVEMAEAFEKLTKEIARIVSQSDGNKVIEFPQAKAVTL